MSCCLVLFQTYTLSELLVPRTFQVQTPKPNKFNVIEKKNIKSVFVFPVYSYGAGVRFGDPNQSWLPVGLKALE